MPIEIGTKLGPYEILAPAGAGGMGEVYKAKDTRLDRTVAIKVLLDLPDKPELAERFAREARAIAALNHPHICTLYDVGRQDGIDYLVMEYVDGETLAHRLQRGAVPLAEIIRYGIEMAAALDNAHRQGIIHRDLKPANVMLTSSGVKLLDFGLAKLREIPDRGPSGTLSMLSTKDRELTLKGTVLGTLQYMSPEQVEGRDADARTDVFALGVVFYEMATGQKAFEGKSQVSLMAAILERDPAAIGSIKQLSPALDRVIRVCLAKEPDDRWQTAREIVRELKWAQEEEEQKAIAIESPAATPLVTARSARRPWLAAAVASAAFLLAMIPAVIHWLEPSPDRRVRRFTIETPPMPSLYAVAISPDGRRLAHVARGPENQNVIWIRPLDSLASQVLPGTEQPGLPFWSPDSRFIVFNSGGKLKKIDLLGGIPQTLCDAQNFNGASWSEAGVIVFSSGGLLYRVPAAGGTPSPLMELNASDGETGHYWPHFLDNNRFLYTVWSADPAKRSIYVGSLEGGERRRLIDAASMAGYSPPGFLLYQRSGTLFAHPFDARDAVLNGDPFPIAEQLPFGGTGRSSFSASTNGTLVYTAGAGAGARSQLAWYDRNGKMLGAVGKPDSYFQARLSPDEKLVVYPRTSSGGIDLWLLELASGIASRFTFEAGGENDPVWSPDGRRVAFFASQDGKQQLFVKTVGANQSELLFASDDPIKYPESWSSDGRTLIFRIGGSGASIHSLALGPQPETKKLFESPFTKDEVQLSPDGRWVSFNSNESGRVEVYIASFPGFTDRRQVSSEGGAQARWRRDGRELFYLSLDGKLMSVELRESATTLQASVPKVLFQTKIAVNPGVDQYNVAANGQKFLLLDPIEGAEVPPITVVLDWTAGIPGNQ